MSNKKGEEFLEAVKNDEVEKVKAYLTSSDRVMVDYTSNNVRAIVLFDIMIIVLLLSILMSQMNRKTQSLFCFQFTTTIVFICLLLVINDVI